MAQYQTQDGGCDEAFEKDYNGDFSADKSVQNRPKGETKNAEEQECHRITVMRGG